jgi:hypothetical protein
VNENVKVKKQNIVGSKNYNMEMKDYLPCWKTDDLE